jgi:transketolase
VKEVLDLAPFADKWRAFGWTVREINGHNFDEIERALTQVPYETGKPSCIIAHTIKGKGVSFMENKLLWHYRIPDGKEYEMAMIELGAS